MNLETEAPHSRHGTGHRWLDILLGVCALFVSVTLLWVAMHHGNIMESLVAQNERLVQANSLPYIQLFGSNVDPERNTTSQSLVIANKGVGPAEIRTVQFLVDGRPVRNFEEVMRTCCGWGRSTGVTTSSLHGLMSRLVSKLNTSILRVIPIRRQPTSSTKHARKADLKRVSAIALSSRNAGRVLRKARQHRSGRRPVHYLNLNIDSESDHSLSIN